MEDIEDMGDRVEEIITDIDAKLDDKDAVRELAMKSSRAIQRLSRRMIQKIHRDQDPSDEFNEAQQEISKLKSIVEEYPELYHSGFLRNGFQEVAEAHLLWAVSDDVEAKKPEELGVTPSAYLIGLGDLVGELRRMCLEEMTEGDMEKARDLLNMMERIKDLLMEIDYPKAIVPIKRKQDVARDLVEKTRGDLAISVRNEELKEKMDELMEDL